MKAMLVVTTPVPPQVVSSVPPVVKRIVAKWNEPPTIGQPVTMTLPSACTTSSSTTSWPPRKLRVIAPSPPHDVSNVPVRLIRPTIASSPAPCASTNRSPSAAKPMSNAKSSAPDWVRSTCSTPSPSNAVSGVPSGFSLAMSVLRGDWFMGSVQ